MEGCNAAEISLLCVFWGVSGVLYCIISYSITPLQKRGIVARMQAVVVDSEQRVQKSTGVVISTTSIAKSNAHQGKRGRSTPKFVQVAIGEPDQVIDDLLDSTVLIEPNHRLVQRHAKIRLQVCAGVGKAPRLLYCTHMIVGGSAHFYVPEFAASSRSRYAVVR